MTAEDSKAHPRMVEIIPLDRVSAGSVAWTLRLPDGGRVQHLTVVVAATYAFDAQGSLSRVDPERLQSERYDQVHGCSDLAPYLPRAEAWLTGVAASPPGQSRTRRLRLAVTGSRVLIDKASDTAASFQRLPPAASARRALAAGLELDRDPFEVAVSSDWRYFQVVAEDQRCEFFEGSEDVVVEGIGDGTEVVRIKLPGARGEVRVFGLLDEGPEELPLFADGLAVDGRRRRLTLRWRGGFPLMDAKDMGRVRVVAGVSTAAAPLDWSAVGRVLALPTPSLRSPTDGAVATGSSGRETAAGWASPQGAGVGVATLVSGDEELGSDSDVDGLAAVRSSRRGGQASDEGRAAAARAVAESDTGAEELREQLGIPVLPRREKGLLGSEVLVASSADAEELRRLLGIGQLPDGGRGSVTVEEQPEAALARQEALPPAARVTAPLGPLPVAGAPWSARGGEGRSPPLRSGDGGTRLALDDEPPRGRRGGGGQ